MEKTKKQILRHFGTSIILYLVVTFSYSQNDCVIVDSYKILDLKKESTNFSISIEDIEGGENKKYFLFNNPTKDTLYVFSSYFEEIYYRSPILNRLNKKSKEKKLSLIPLINYLTPNLNDLIMLKDDALINKGQLSYSFIQIPPKKSCSVIFDLNLILNDRYAKDINVRDLAFNDKIKWKEVKERKKISYKKIIEFAIYNSNVKKLCDIDYYVSKTNEYFQLAKSYKIYSLEKKDGKWVEGLDCDDAD
ncbi:hypothetical protein ACJD0Z_15185 [Flavobacteriaceae bacterium M23B6Z8]